MFAHYTVKLLVFWRPDFYNKEDYGLFAVDIPKSWSDLPDIDWSLFTYDMN
jgi:hypothetical protein